MSPAKVNELFDILRAACGRQFGFNPRRVAAEMRYVGKEGHGNDLVHVFRDARTHSQEALKGTFASLREKHGEKPHWTDAEKAHYRNTDAEIDGRGFVILLCISDMLEALFKQTSIALTILRVSLGLILCNAS